MAKKQKKGIVQRIVSTLVLTAVSAGVAVVTTLVVKKLADKSLPEADVADAPADREKKEETGEEQYITLNEDEKVEEPATEAEETEVTNEETVTDTTK